MKKKIAIGIIAIIVVLCSFSVGVISATKYTVYVNTVEQKTDVKIINKKAYVPLKDAVKWFDADLKYDSKKGKYMIYTEDFIFLFN